MGTEMKPMTLNGALEVAKADDVLLCVEAGTVSFTKGNLYSVNEDGEGLFILDNALDETYSGILSKFTFVPLEPPKPAPEAVDPDIVHNPPHYARFTIQPLEFCMKNRLEGHVWNIVKYTCRAGHKLYPGKTEAESEVIDLEKAIDIAQKRIRMLKGEPLFVDHRD
jgi:hypothetical protein